MHATSMCMCAYCKELEYGCTVQLCTWNTAEMGPELPHSRSHAAEYRAICIRVGTITFVQKNVMLNTLLHLYKIIQFQ